MYYNIIDTVAAVSSGNGGHCGPIEPGSLPRHISDTVMYYVQLFINIMCIIIIKPFTRINNELR